VATILVDADVMISSNNQCSTCRTRFESDL